MAKYLDQNGAKRLVDNLKAAQSTLNTKINSEIVARENFATDATSSIAALDTKVDDATADMIQTIAVDGTTLSITSGAGSTDTYQIQDTTYDLATTINAGLMSASDKSKLDGLTEYTLPTASSTTKGGVKIGNGLSMSGDTLNVTIPYEFPQKVTLDSGLVARNVDGIDLCGSYIYIQGGAISGAANFSNTTIKGSPSIEDKLTLQAGFDSGFTNIGIRGSSIDAGGASINANRTTIDGVPQFTGTPYLSGGFQACTVHCYLDDSTIKARNALIEAEKSTFSASLITVEASGASINESHASINASGTTINASGASINAGTILEYATISGNLIFTDTPTLSGGFRSRNAQIEMFQSSIDLGRTSIDCGKQGWKYYEGIGNVSDSTCTIIGDPIFTGKVMFSEPIYIDNTSSTVKGALCFDIENNLPRLKLLVKGVEYIFNCDTSVTGGAG